MFLSRSTGRRAVVTLVAVLAFACLFEASILDSRRFQKIRALADSSRPMRFTATAYCKGTTTASGVNVRHGIAAADPRVLPVGSVVRVEKLDTRYDGIYTVMDTGPKVQGRHVDIYIWSCNEALQIGRRAIGLTVLRLGWNPQATRPSPVDRVLRSR